MQKKKKPKQPEHARQRRGGDEEGGGGGSVGAEGLGEEKMRRKRASVLSCSKACDKERVRRAGASVLSLPIPRWKVLYSASFPLRAGIYTLSMYSRYIDSLHIYCRYIYSLYAAGIKTLSLFIADIYTLSTCTAFAYTDPFPLRAGFAGSHFLRQLGLGHRPAAWLTRQILRVCL